MTRNMNSVFLSGVEGNGRRNVVALIKGDIEKPNDIGVVYINY